MNAIFGDPSVYASAAVVLAGIAAFPFVLKRYRAAAPAAESPAAGGLDALLDKEEGPIPLAEPVKKKAAAPLPDAEDRASAPAALPQAEKTMRLSPEAAESALKASVAAAQPELPPKEAAPRRGTASATTTGGISPAVVYLQNLKIQMEHFEGEVKGLRTQLLGFAQKQDKESQKHDKEFLVLLKTMGDFQKDVRQQMDATQAALQQATTRAPAPEPEPKPQRRARAAGPAPEPAPEPVVVPAPEPAPEISVAPAEAPAPEPAPAEPVPVLAAEPPEPAPQEAPVAAAEPPAPEAAPQEVSGAASAEDIAATLTLTLPDAVAQEPAAAAAESPALTLEPAAAPATQAPEDDPLRPPKSKGPVWPV
ncbi:MAG: hypothetical protein A2X36_00940 [Elusimicrobia bacterium GWA2_69_24]|nr:MAG: hypothetical protein A2X36_00940 [Elusimicrobia bacterium GWA2_69_24]HBL16542.1 hypothetical protein [Elusimicrobiota bacterium]